MQPGRGDVALTHDALFEPAHDLIREAAQLLRHADRSWTALAGSVRSRYNEELLDLGRAYGRSSKPGSWSSTARQAARAERADGVLDLTCQFWAAASPWRLRMEKVREDGATPDQEPFPQLLIVNQDSWWAVADGVTTNAGDPSSRHGTESLDVLLHPSPLVEGLTFTAAQRTSEAGRPAILLRAAPSDGLIWTAPALVVLGAEQVSVVVDATLGVVLRFSAVIADEVAREHSIQSLSEMHDLDPELFQAPPG